MTKILKCSKCQSDMAPGFILDQMRPAEGFPSKWVEGAPQKSFMLGVKRDVALEIVTYRCSGCGFLESYAW